MLKRMITLSFITQQNGSISDKRYLNVIMDCVSVAEWMQNWLTISSLARTIGMIDLTMTIYNHSVGDVIRLKRNVNG